MKQRGRIITKGNTVMVEFTLNDLIMEKVYIMMDESLTTVTVGHMLASVARRMIQEKAPKLYADYKTETITADGKVQIYFERSPS
jgi:hypothetical protein